MRCFTCNARCNGELCNSCAADKAAQRRSDSVWSPKVVRTKLVATDNVVSNDTFASKLKAALVR